MKTSNVKELKENFNKLQSNRMISKKAKGNIWKGSRRNPAI